MIGRFALAMSDGIEWLRKNGHPKWKAVDLNFPLKGWDQYDCVAKYRSQGRAVRDGDQAVVAQSGARGYQGHARQLSRPTSRPVG